MTEPDTHRCAACGHTAPVEIKQQTAFHVSFLAPAGICRDIIIADTPQGALDKALHRVEMQNNLKAEDFDPVAESYSVQQITIDDPDGAQMQAVWTYPAYLIEKHSTETLDFLEALIEAVDELADSRRNLDEAIGNVDNVAADASRELKRLGLKGGAQ